MSDNQELDQAVAASNLFAKALFVTMEEGEGLLLKSVSECEDYKKDELVVVAKLNSHISIVPYKAIEEKGADLKEGQWVKLGED
tara:strand:+ start:1635 stop:1886 length:252 start_codon:yes stop_codon:yes gene_type:complete